MEISGIIQPTGNRILWHWDTNVLFPQKTTPTNQPMKASNALVAAALAGVFAAGTVASAAYVPGDKDKDKDDCPGKDKEKKEELVVTGDKEKDKDDCPGKDKDDCPGKDKDKDKDEEKKEIL